MNRCTWTETLCKSLFKADNIQIQCENMTDEQFDEYGRAYCKEHRIKVDEINKSRHKNCINKEKLIEHIKNINFKGIFGLLIKNIENGEFDNE